MANVELVKKLRADTGVSIALCNKALNESKDNMEKAKVLLAKWGTEIADKKSDRGTEQGIIASYIHHNRRFGATVTLLCETDFVAKNEGFIKLGNEIAMQIASMQPKTSEELLAQAYIRDSAKTVGQLIKEHITKLGENIKVGEFVRLSL
ncbi:MAG: elongation factor Ts [Patescibacteria group bacterium]|jgi:elongation factor Ts